MNILTQAADFRHLNVEIAPSVVKITILGLPEDVQWVADVLEIAIPGVMDWQSFAGTSASCLIEVNGMGQKPGNGSNVELC